VESACKVVDDYFGPGAEGMDERYIVVDFDTARVSAIVVDDRVWRVHITSDAFRTADSIGVGTPLARLLRVPGLRGAEGEGRLFVFSPERCGLSFRLSNIPRGGEHRGAWDLAALRSLPAGTVVDEVLSFGCGDAGQSARGDDAGQTALVGGTVYSAPGEAPVYDAVVLIEGQHIRQVGERGRVQVPAGARVIDLAGMTVLPAFWNSHVHLMEPKWAGVDTIAAERLSALLEEMFTRYGFAHVVDIGSFDSQTLTLRRRIEGGAVLGPDILTTLTPFVPPSGTPWYVEPLRLPELRDAASARDSTALRITQGADAIKLFPVPITRTRPFPVMDPSVIRAVTETAHRAGRQVLAHPTDLAGIEVSLAAGVDILAHAAPTAGRFPDSIFTAMSNRRMALIPTLTLWEDEFGPDTLGMGEFVRTAQEQVRAYLERGGRILFGTDVGFIARYDPTREYQLMAGAGLDFPTILRSLTTAPAAQFGRDDRTGRIAPGLDADIVVVEGDPAREIEALARARLTMKRGRIIFQ
jgi:imidazolonepropionase-like amidohydrolase